MKNYYPLLFSLAMVSQHLLSMENKTINARKSSSDDSLQKKIKEDSHVAISAPANDKNPLKKSLERLSVSKRLSLLANRKDRRKKNASVGQIPTSSADSSLFTGEKSQADPASELDSSIFSDLLVITDANDLCNPDALTLEQGSTLETCFYDWADSFENNEAQWDTYYSKFCLEIHKCNVTRTEFNKLQVCFMEWLKAKK